MMTERKRNGTKTVTAAERATIRAYLCVGQGNRRCRITRAGNVHYYGSTESTDRQHDYWHYAGEVAEVLATARLARKS